MVWNKNLQSSAGAIPVRIGPPQEAPIFSRNRLPQEVSIRVHIAPRGNTGPYWASRTYWLVEVIENDCVVTKYS